MHWPLGGQKFSSLQFNFPCLSLVLLDCRTVVLCLFHVLYRAIAWFYGAFIEHFISLLSGGKHMCNSPKNSLPMLVMTFKLNGGLNQMVLLCFCFLSFVVSLVSLYGMFIPLKLPPVLNHLVQSFCLGQIKKALNSKKENVMSCCKYFLGSLFPDFNEVLPCFRYELICLRI